MRGRKFVVSSPLTLRDAASRRPALSPWGEGELRRLASSSVTSSSDGMVDRHMLGAFGMQQLADHPVLRRLDLHGRLVGLDLGHHVAASHRVAFLDVPFDELALLHGGRQLRHEDLHLHGQTFPLRGGEGLFPMLAVEQGDAR